MSLRKCSATPVRDQDYNMNLKLHKRILRFFSKVDNSGQMGPLINNAIKRQHLAIPGPSGFHQRRPKDVQRVQLLEYYDSDSFFSEQAFKRLQHMKRILPGTAFLKLMEVLVAIFDVYLATKDSRHRKLKGSFDRTRNSQMKVDENTSVMKHDSTTNHPAKTVQFMEKSRNIFSNKDSFNSRFKGLHPIKIKPCLDNVEMNPPKERVRRKENKIKDRRYLSKGNNSAKCPLATESKTTSKGSMLVNSSIGVSPRTVDSMFKIKISGSQHKYDSHSKILKRQCPSHKGSNSSNKRQKRSCEDLDSAMTPIEQCARLRVWEGSV